MGVEDGREPLLPATAPERIRADVDRQLAILAQAGRTGTGALQAALEMVGADIANAPELAEHQVSDRYCIVCSESERRGRPFIPVLCGVPDRVHWLHATCHDEHARRVTVKVEQIMAAAGYGAAEGVAAAAA